MKILVLNAGSSSLKFNLIESKQNFKSLYKGIIEGLCFDHCELKTEQNGKKNTQKITVKNYEEAVEYVIQLLKTQKIITDFQEIKAVGHRVVHGGEKYHSPTLITPQVVKDIDALATLAPLHNPPNLKAIEGAQKIFKKIPHVAVFDTAFHQTMPESAYLYALPYELYKNKAIRKYGFHGTSHHYVAKETIKLLKKSRHAGGRIITCHLGNGASICAIKNGKSIDTSMGFTPLEGIPMGTRSGDIDPAIIFHLLNTTKMSPTAIKIMLEKKSGLKGLSELSADMRDLYTASLKKQVGAKRALAVYAYRIAKYIASYAAALNGVDAITFTAGIGEKAWYMRRDICKALKFLGVKIDSQKNQKNAIIISNGQSKIKVFVIPTNEEKQIAIETLKLLNNL